MFKNPSFLFDIICTAAWIILVVRYARKGFLSSIVQLVGNLFSLLGAKELSAACAGWVDVYKRQCGDSSPERGSFIRAYGKMIKSPP